MGMNSGNEMGDSNEQAFFIPPFVSSGQLCAAMGVLICIRSASRIYAGH